MSNNLGGFKLLRGKLKEGQCPDCATVHEPPMPHNQQSLHWQYSFMEKNGRWPTWKDAMAHCSDEMKAAWIKELTNRNIKIE